jgi:uncharacterized protein (DUF1778 family)
MENDTVQRKAGRSPAPHRPVLSARMTAESYDRLTAAAKASGRTVSEEADWRINQSFGWEKTPEIEQAILEKAREDARAIVTHAEFITEKTAQTELERELRRRGYRLVRGVTGAAWFEPGVDAINWIADPALLEDLLRRAFAFALKELASSAIRSGRE